MPFFFVNHIVVTPRVSYSLTRNAVAAYYWRET